MTFIVAHAGGRDSYQVALALAERNALSSLVSDYYHQARSWANLSRFAHRSTPFLSPHLAHPVPSAFGLYCIRAAIPSRVRRHFPSPLIDRAIARQVARLAREDPEQSLFLYAGNAEEAFRLPGRRLKILFCYHPLSSLVSRELLNDSHAFSSLYSWHEPECNPRSYVVRRVASEAALADLVFCASQFTRESLILEGIPPDKIRVVPYGCPAVGPRARQTVARKRTLLFVGQGVQRKGLHHLALAWREARLKRWTLRVVCTSIDPTIARLFVDMENVEVSGAVSRSQLQSAMCNADTLVLPSLAEGFGLVLTEALAAGCRLIASDGTGLSALQLPPHLGRLVPRGDIPALVSALRWADESFDVNGGYREAALDFAATYSWDRFRERIWESLLPYVP